MIADAEHRRSRGREPRIVEHGGELLHQLRLGVGVPDHRHEVRVLVPDTGDPLEHLEAADREVIA